jgi:hypothetical protein
VLGARGRPCLAQSGDSRRSETATAGTAMSSEGRDREAACSDGEMPGAALVPIEYRDALVALVSARRFHIVAPWLVDRPPGDPELRFVAYMCAC